MSLLGKLMSNARKADISFGIHTNCVVMEVSNEKRKNKDKEVIKRNCFTKIGKLDDKGNVTAEKEISWFNVNAGTDYAYDNMFTQIDQMTGIIKAVLGEDGLDKWRDGLEAALEEEEAEWTKDSTADDAKEILTEITGDKGSCGSFLKAIGDLYVELLSENLGTESTKIRFKVVFEKSGKFLQQPKFDSFVESMEVEEDDSRLRISKTEEGYRQKSLNTSTPVSKKPKTNI